MERNKKTTINIILGPTSTGKTSLALELCKKISFENGKKSKGEILSADSRQIYKHMDIGTGKLPIGSEIKVERGNKKWVLDGVNIWGYDLANPDEYFSSYNYAKFGLEKLGELSSAQKTTFIVGGTGFYIDILTGRRRLSGTKPDFELRKTLETTSTQNLLKKLMSLNDNKYSSIDTKNRRRIIRAIEIELTNTKEKNAPLPYLDNVKYEYFGLKAPNEFMYEKVDKWMEFIWANGLIEEVQNLLDLGFENTPKLQGLIYKSVVSFLKKDLIENEALQRAKYDLHAYIRRQITWFKKNPDIYWFDISMIEREKILDQMIMTIK